ncbi:MAG: Gfo/Idh/MocA family oxidoreductase, partial [Chloroflexi bacterium]|nr:Gfo/Idh/MocA family oxidoreductase [Chloroflexota bacterium]
FARAYAAELEEWVESVDTGGARGPSAWDGYAAAVVADGCLESLETGRRTAVRLNDRPAFYGNPA